MMEDNLIPVLPESAPFTPEQRAYLNGFLAGLFSRTPAPAARQPSEATAPKPPLTILFGSQTGNAEALAKRVAKQAAGYETAVFDMAAYPLARLPSEERLLVITSTYGDGEPPDNARALWQFLSATDAPPLPAVQFSVLSLGDSNYPKFCECGKQFDRRLEELGGRRVFERIDCDVEFEERFGRWLENVLPAFGAPAPAHNDSPRREAAAGSGPARRAPAVQTTRDAPTETMLAKPGHARKNPFPAPLVVNRLLNGPGSSKETRHFEFSLQGCGLSYQAGDALGVLPSNSPCLVDDILRALHWTGEERVSGPGGDIVTTRHALAHGYEITRIPAALLQLMAERTGDANLKRLTGSTVNGELADYLWGREVIDLLLAFPGISFEPAEFVRSLKKLHPRLYSISSSPAAHPDAVHLTVGIVRYASYGRRREGVCSTFLADRVKQGQSVPVFIHQNKNFSLPADATRPIVMVGPGTGIAPFRGFLHERRAAGAPGRNWLLFGDQRAACDFLYRDELEAMKSGGSLHRLETAFSRDQEQKVYVQHRMLEQADELFAWLEEGAHFYVCGDAKRMAKDVDAALHRIIELAGNRTPEKAAEYVAQLKAQQRYQRDVY